MRILKESPKPKEYKIECSGCKCWFAAFKNEFGLSHDRNESYYSIKCPSCNKSESFAREFFRSENEVGNGLLQ